MTKEVIETTTGASVGAGMPSPMASDDVSHEFYLKYGRMKAAGLQTSFASFIAARNIKKEDAERVRERLEHQYGVYGIGRVY